eukprot:5455186-Alexandrium_andersonii.AAC.1
METEAGIDRSVIGKSRVVPSLFRPMPPRTPESMPEDARAVFCQGRVIDHVSVNRFMMDQVSAWSKLMADVKAYTSNILRAAV